MLSEPLFRFLCGRASHQILDVYSLWPGVKQYTGCAGPSSERNRVWQVSYPLLHEEYQYPLNLLQFKVLIFLTLKKIPFDWLIFYKKKLFLRGNLECRLCLEKLYPVVAQFSK